MQQFDDKPARNIFLIFLLLMFTANLSAQLGPGTFRGMTLGVRYNYFDPAVVHQAMAEGGQVRYFGLISPKAPLTYTSSINWVLGARFNTDGDSTDFIWRFNIADGEVKRKLLAYGYTILDLDQSGSLKRNFRWVNVRVGPGVSVGGQKLSFGVKVMGTLGIHSIRFGKDNYSELGNMADSTLSGIEAGFRITAPLQIASKLMLFGEYSDRVLVDGQEPRFKTFSGGLRLAFGKPRGAKFILSASYHREEVSFNDSPLEFDNNFFQAQIQFTPAPPKPRSQFDDEFDRF